MANTDYDRLSLVRDIMQDDTDVNPEFIKAQQRLSRTRQLKVLNVRFVGSYRCGKGTMLYRFQNKKYLDNVTCSVMTVYTNNNKIFLTTYKFGNHHTLETLNQSMIRQHLRVVCFDLNDLDSFKSIQQLVDDKRNKVQFPDDKMLLLGLKSDLEQTVPQELIDQIKIQYIPVSTKLGVNVEETLDTIINKCKPVTVAEPDYTAVRNAIDDILKLDVKSPTPEDNTDPEDNDLEEPTKPITVLDMAKKLYNETTPATKIIVVLMAIIAFQWFN